MKLLEFHEVFLMQPWEFCDIRSNSRSVTAPVALGLVESEMYGRMDLASLDKTKDLLSAFQWNLMM
jgi:hypothetical protein